MALPAHIQKYFWDINSKHMDPKKYPKYVIERILELGDEKAISWLKEIYSARTINRSTSEIIRFLRKRLAWQLSDLKNVEDTFLCYNLHKMNRIMTSRYIVINPKICHGKPTFKKTRVMVWQVLDLLAAGESKSNILKAFPSLAQEHIKAALSYASSVVREGNFTNGASKISA